MAHGYVSRRVDILTRITSCCSCLYLKGILATPPKATPPRIRPYQGTMKIHWFPLIRPAINPLFLGGGVARIPLKYLNSLRFSVDGNLETPRYPPIPLETVLSCPYGAILRLGNRPHPQKTPSHKSVFSCIPWYKYMNMLRLLGSLHKKQK